MLLGSLYLMCAEGKRNEMVGSREKQGLGTPQRIDIVSGPEG